MSSKILVSWVAFYHDFKDGKVNPEGPNYTLHRTYYDTHAMHLLLSTGKPGETRAAHLYTQLKKDFPEHNITLVHLSLDSFLDFKEIKHKAEQAIRPYRDKRMEILFSTGSTPMRMCWVLLHLEKNGYDTQLLQSLDKQMGRGNAYIMPMEIDASTFAYRLEIRTQEQQQMPRKELVTQSLLPAYSRAEKIALHPEVSILIQGESGTGKELLARFIHKHSARQQAPFIAVNCAAIGNELLESRLFGYSKGSFTGAEKDRKGYFEAAEGGTLFLDEIGDISPYMQQALLRALQEKRIQRVGEWKERAVNVRIVAATNQQLMEKCKQGSFRWDLYYRLAETEIHLPTLRAYSPEDRWQLIRHLLTRKEKQYGHKAPLRLEAEVQTWLKTYNFPGNIRELDHILTNFCIFAEDRQVRMAHLPRSHQHTHSKPLLLEDAIRNHIQSAYHLLDKNISRTAREVGRSVNTVKRYLKEAGEI